MNKDELDEILAKHKLWLEGKPNGERANLSGVNLSGTDLTGAYLYGANLTEANLTRANLTRANLSGVNLTRANLYGANLSGTDLTGADLRRAFLIDILGKDIYTFSYNKHNAVYVDGYLRIGCECHKLDYWLKNYKEIGREANYTKKEIKAYGDFIKWLKRR